MARRVPVFERRYRSEDILPFFDFIHNDYVQFLTDIAVVMGVTAIGIHSAVDFNLQIPANAFAFMILLAFGWLSLYLGRRRRRIAPDLRRLPKTETLLA